MAERASDRLLRLLGIVAYLDRHEDATVDAIADQFGVSPAQVVDDIETLWVTGTPGYFPYDLIDFDATSYERGVVRLTESRNMTRPLRLGAREGVALVAALRALHSALGGALDAGQAEVLASALAKLTAAVGDGGGVLDVALSVVAAPDVASAIATALRDRRRLHLRYVNAADVTSERDVDPIRLVTDAERSYLLAWCLASDEERLFRVDRVLAARVLEAPAQDHDVAVDADVFAPGPEGDLVTVRLASHGRWVAEVTPAEAVRNLDDGSFELELRVVSSPWLRQLLLQVAEDVLEVRPAAVAHEVAAQARAALAAYGPLGEAAPARGEVG